MGYTQKDLEDDFKYLVCRQIPECIPGCIVSSWRPTQCAALLFKCAITPMCHYVRRAFCLEDYKRSSASPAGRKRRRLNSPIRVDIPSESDKCSECGGEWVLCKGDRVCELCGTCTTDLVSIMQHETNYAERDTWTQYFTAPPSEYRTLTHFSNCLDQGLGHVDRSLRGRYPEVLEGFRNDINIRMCPRPYTFGKILKVARRRRVRGYATALYLDLNNLPNILFEEAKKEEMKEIHNKFCKVSQHRHHLLGESRYVPSYNLQIRAMLSLVGRPELRAFFPVAATRVARARFESNWAAFNLSE